MPPSHRATVRLEICIDTPEGLATALAAGADRIELCADLGVGGLTPSPGLIAVARGAPVPVYAMIRPRQGDFIYGPQDLEAMLADIAAVRQAGLDGVVLGASLPDRSLDAATLKTLCDASLGLGRTLHRAFDLVPDRDAALDMVVGLGFERILTSGGVSDADRGRDSLRALVASARDRLSIMAGGSITPQNVADIIAHTGVGEVHASAKIETVEDDDLVRWGFCAPRRYETSGATIQALRAAIAAMAGE